MLLNVADFSSKNVTVPALWDEPDITPLSDINKIPFVALTTSFWNICVLSVFLTTILSTSNNVPSLPLSSILNPSPLIPDINVEVPIVFVSATVTSPTKAAVLPSTENFRTPPIYISTNLLAGAWSLRLSASSPAI